MNCKYYYKDHPLEGTCMFYTDYTDPMPTVVYCSKLPCDEYEESKPAYEELYEYWLKTKDKPKRKRKKVKEDKQLPRQLSLFDEGENYE